MITACTALYQLNENTKLRERELRFKQAEAGKQFLEELFEDKEAATALEMLDSPKNSFKNGRLVVSADEIPEAIRNAEGEDEKTVLIARSFDALFYQLSTIENCIESELTTLENVKHPMNYYVRKLAKNKEIYRQYIEKYTYKKALDLLDRFPDWNPDLKLRKK